MISLTVPDIRDEDIEAVNRVLQSGNLVQGQVVEKFENLEDDNNLKIVNFNDSQQYLIKSFIYSVFIYVIFVLSTKSEGKYLVFFLLATVFMVFLQIILKSMYGPLSEFKMTNIFKSNAELKQMAKESELPYDQNLTNILRVIPGLYAIIGGVGPAKFYETTFGAKIIEGSDPGIYKGILSHVPV